MADADRFDGAALARWLEVWRFNPTKLSQRLGVSPQTVWNWRQSSKPLKPWVRLALHALEQEERQRLTREAG